MSIPASIATDFALLVGLILICVSAGIGILIGRDWRRVEIVPEPQTLTSEDAARRTS